MKNIAITLGYIVLFLSIKTAFAQQKSLVSTQATATTFELMHGDRVVFLGNSLFENDLRYGYLELAFTTRWPGRTITFRNIGWTGDTVWGEARSYISPPSTYDLLIEQLTKAQPTVVFIAYGGIEALDGEQNLPRFKEGLHKLLDKIDQLRAKAILLSPIPVLDAGAKDDTDKRNTLLELYTSAIAKTAAERGKQFIDIYHPLLEKSKNIPLSDNGFHLNENGYYFLASTIEKALGLASRDESISIDVSKQAVDATATIKILDWGKNDKNVTFTLAEHYLPLPVPQQAGEAGNTRVIKIAGLKKGIYTLTSDNSQVITASANQWSEGVEIRQGASFDQVRGLQELIIKKNELFFHQYRPQNKTYILGFRSHEQGRHTQGLEELSTIITWLEGQIGFEEFANVKKLSTYPH